MGNKEIVLNQTHPKISIISLNRPEKRNALNQSLMQELVETIKHVEKDSLQRILILKGEGTVFCAGMDLAEATSPNMSEELSDWITKSLTTLYQSRLITIAMVQGAVIGGGAGLASCCDFVVAAENTRIGYPETRRGLVAAQVLTFLRRQVKERDVRELLFFGELIDAKKALEIGLINRVVQESELLNEAHKIAEQVLKNAPKATEVTKALIDEMYAVDFKADLKKGRDAHNRIHDSNEVKEGIAAFLEKRTPNWI